MPSTADKIRFLNDHLRTTFIGGCILVTSSIAELEPELKAKILVAVREFKDFNSDNDPHHEHDLAFFEVDGERYFFKVDYFDLDAKFHAPDPADPERTCRVLTIGHHSDY